MPRWTCSVCLCNPCECWTGTKFQFQLVEGWCFVHKKSKMSCGCS